MTGNGVIVLTAEEAALVSQIEFDALLLRGAEHARQNGELAVALFRLLKDRDAIPAQRRDYFMEADQNPGGRGKSRFESFRQNAGSSDAVLRHPHFLKYLHYFIHGADLPSATAASFAAVVESCGPLTSGDTAVLTAEARRLTRRHGLERTGAAEEFFKLALDCGAGVYDASAIRKAVLSVRT